jgi:N,N'-diacetyllegionaminate synthase
LGACIVEKHLTLDRGMPGPDHLASSDPDELARLVGSIRNIEAAFGNGRKTPAEGEAEIAMVARKSLVASRDIGEGDVLTSDLIAVRRPGNGLPPTFLPHVLGRRLRRPVLAGAVLTLEMLH